MNFRSTIWIGRFTGWLRLSEGKMLRSSVNSGGGTEDEALDADRTHGFEQFDRARDIVVKILKRFPDGFAYSFKAGKVNDRFNTLVTKHLFEQFPITNVAFNEGRRVTCDTADAIDDTSISV